MKNSMKKILVTGHQGYIGAYLTGLLKAEGHTVTGVDLGLYEECKLEGFTQPDNEIQKDFRNLTHEELKGHDAVMHLAAISNDPMGELNPQLTLNVNLHGSIELARKAKEAGISRFLFSGSCSVYGKGDKLDLEETDPVNPLTAYARSKIETEKEVSKMADESFTPVFLRNATAYGYSPMLRIDLVVNNLLGSVHAYNEIRIKSDGTPWRPLIHAKDIARAFVALYKAPKEKVHNKIINIGDNKENYQVKDIADQIRTLVPEGKIVFTNEVGNDPRNYRVKFDKLNKLLPEFKLEYTLEKGMKELHDKYLGNNFGKEDFEGEKFVRIRLLKNKMHKLNT
jgi:nucleoside-diphosphate-sugar epimerase